MKRIALALIISVAFATALVLALMGDGGFKRMVTITGVYSICKPDGYEVVCFLDADGREGGMFCLPLAQVGGECRR